MATIIRQSTAMTHLMGPFIDNTDGVTAKTALTITQALTRLSKNGGDPAQKNEASSAVHKENGYYAVALDTTDTNTVGRLRVMVTISGAMQVADDFIVIAAAAYDAMVAGSAGMVTDISTLVNTNLDAKISTRMATFTYTAPPSATDIWAAAARTLTDKTGFSLSQSFPANFASLGITAGGAVTAGTVSDKTGYTCTVSDKTGFDLVDAPNAKAVTAIQSGLMTSGAYTAPDNTSIGTILTTTNKVDSMIALNGAAYEYKTTALVNAPGVDAGTIWTYVGRSLDADPILDKVDTMLQAGTAPATYQYTTDALEQAPGVDASTIWGYTTRSLTDKVGFTASTVTDKTGYSLSVTPPTAVQIDTQLSATHGTGPWATGGSGAIVWTYNVTNSITHLPLEGVYVNATSDITGLISVAQGFTDPAGNVVFYLDAGTYYMWCYKTGFNFTNPDTEVVS